MKRYYTVKEAAKLLGVSTNTVYKDLKDGKLVGRRIGKGRFKIPQKALSPYVDLTVSEEPEENFQNNPTETVNDKPVQSLLENQLNPPASTENYPTSLITAETAQDLAMPQNSRSDLSLEKNLSEVKEKVSEQIENALILPDRENISEANDLLFFRIFKAVLYLGLGIIYVFPGVSLFAFQNTFIESQSSLFFKLLPFGLITAGILNLVDVIKPKAFEKFHLQLDFFSALILGYFSFVCVVSGEYGLFAFTASLTVIAVNHLVSGAREKTQEVSQNEMANRSTFFAAFSKFALVLTVIGGVIITIFPSTFPFQSISEYFTNNRTLVSTLWFFGFSGFLIYFLSFYGKKSALRIPFFVISSTFVLLIATQLTIQGKWDIAYFSYITGIFGLFLAYWIDGNKVVDLKKVWLVVLSFSWTMISLVVGLYALNLQRIQIRDEYQGVLDNNLTRSVSSINADFAQRSSVMTEVAGRDSIKNLVRSRDSEGLINIAKDIYQKASGVASVKILDKDGVALGVYPRNSLFQGTNFSSRDYFLKTSSSYRGVISSLFEDLSGTSAIVQTEPVFKNNNLVALIAVNIDLNKLSSKFQSENNSNFSLSATDSNGYVVFSSDASLIGTKDSMQKKGSFDIITTSQAANIPQWNVLATAQLTTIVTQTSNLNIIISFLLVLNSFFSISAGVFGATRKRDFTDKEDMNISPTKMGSTLSLQEASRAASGTIS